MTNTPDITSTVIEKLGRHTLSWKPKDIISIDSTPEYVTFVDGAGVAEVASALEKYKGLGLDGDAVTKHNFPLPTLQAKLDRVCREIHDGRGFSVIRGLDPNLTPEDQLLVFLGIASYIGDVRGQQDRRGSMITHITQAKTWTTPPDLRHGIHTDRSLHFHTDTGVDILALQVRSLAAKGGDTYVASAFTICSELIHSHPDVLEVLMRATWPVQISGSPPQHILMPLVTVNEGKLFVAVDPGRLGLHPSTVARDPGVPELSVEQRNALEVLSLYATKYRVRLDMRPGDIAIVNNWAMLHARDAYSDSEDGDRRHLVRLWLRNSSLAWPVPESMRAPWAAAFGPKGDGNPVVTRGGRRVVVDKNYPVLPSPVYSRPRYTAGSAAFILEDSEDVNAGSVAKVNM